MTREEVLRAIKEELDEISEECVREGYPSNGSNWELRAENCLTWWREQYPEYHL